MGVNVISPKYTKDECNFLIYHWKIVFLRVKCILGQDLERVWFSIQFVVRKFWDQIQWSTTN